MRTYDNANYLLKNITIKLIQRKRDQFTNSVET